MLVAAISDRAASLRAGLAWNGSDRAQPMSVVLLDRRDQLGVLVADVDVDQLAGEVEEATPGLVPHPRSLATGYDQGVEVGLS
jgi:hypothetical protein